MVIGSLERHRNWLWFFVFLGMLAICMLWYIQQNPHFIYSLVIAFSVATIFCALLALRPKFRQALSKSLLEFYRRDLESGGLFHRFGRLAAILSIINWLIFGLMLKFHLVSPQHSYFVLTFFYIQLILGIIFILSLLKAVGRWWRYLLISLSILHLAVIATITAILIFSS